MNKPDSEKRQEDLSLLHELQTEGSKALEKLYGSYRSEFIAFARRYQLGEDDILDAYQDAIIAFYENVSTGKLSKLSGSLKTYLFSIGKYKLIDLLKQKGKTVSTEDFEQMQEKVEHSYMDQMNLTHRQQQLRTAINKLGAQCKELLILFYYRRYSIEAIQIEMQYKNENTVKAHKSRCMKSLREIAERMEI